MSRPEDRRSAIPIPETNGSAPTPIDTRAAAAAIAAGADAGRKAPPVRRQVDQPPIQMRVEELMSLAERRANVLELQFQDALKREAALEEYVAQLEEYAGLPRTGAAAPAARTPAETVAKDMKAAAGAAAGSGV